MSSNRCRGPRPGARTVEVLLGAADARVDVEVAGSRTQHRRGYRGGGPWGLTRWVDPADGAAYVVFSGALGGAADLLGGADGPGDLRPTTVTVHDPRPGAVVVTPPAGAMLAGHHLGFAAGPFRTSAGDGVVVHARRSVPTTGDLVAETRAALDWMLDFFGGPGPWESDYVQVLVPHAPWLAMEHPGCVLVSEQLLARDPALRLAVLAHEAAHQWLGNLVAPATYADIGAFEGLAELLGQLACSDLLGAAAQPYLGVRRQAAPLVRVRGRDPRADPRTAGLAEVAGPAQHAELYRSVRDSLGAGTFRDRIRRLVRDRGGAATSAAQVWAALGVETRVPRHVDLPASACSARRVMVDRLRDLRVGDPGTAVLNARRAFRSARGDRVADALAALGDPALPEPVAVGLAAELAAGGRPTPASTTGQGGVRTEI